MTLSERQRRRIARQVPALDPRVEREALEWIEAVGDFDNEPVALPRAGWAEACKELAETGDDKLIWPEFPNLEDEELDW